jgi:hypothetical protein
MTFKSWLQQSKQNWLPLAQGGLWMGGILGGFLLPPPVGVTAGDEKIWLRLGQFIIAIVLGLVFLAARRWNQSRYSLRWGAAALVFLLLAVGAFFRYQQLTLAWTGTYAGDQVVIGSEFTEQGRAYASQNPKMSTEELIFNFAGKTEDIWTRESINRRRLLLAATYVSCLPLFTICLMSVVQAVHSPRDSKKTARRKK